MSISKVIAMALEATVAALAIAAFAFLVATGRTETQEIGRYVLGQPVSEPCCKCELASECCPQPATDPCVEGPVPQAGGVDELGSKP